MRAFKFRVWNEDSKEMWLSAEVNLDNGTLLVEDGCTIMQYTGLKDKNGKEIYEGDIVRAFGNLFVVGYGEYEFDVPCAEYNTEAFSWGFYLYNKAGFYKQINYYSRSDVEVIGNIYENPELLKER